MTRRCLRRVVAIGVVLIAPALAVAGGVIADAVAGSRDSARLTLPGCIPA